MQGRHDLQGPRSPCRPEEKSFAGRNPLTQGQYMHYTKAMSDENAHPEISSSQE